MISIRPFEKKDIDAVVAIENAVFPAPWYREAFLKFSLDSCFEIWVAADPVAGYLVAQRVGEEAEIHNIAVALKFQHHGIGSHLLNHFLRNASKKSVMKVFLMVRASNVSALRFYQKFGFATTGKRPQCYQNPVENAFLLEKSL